jgi:hypothetical protein
LRELSARGRTKPTGKVGWLGAPFEIAIGHEPDEACTGRGDASGRGHGKPARGNIAPVRPENPPPPKHKLAD